MLNGWPVSLVRDITVLLYASGKYIPYNLMYSFLLESKLQEC